MAIEFGRIGAYLEFADVLFGEERNSETTAPSEATFELFEAMFATKMQLSTGTLMRLTYVLVESVRCGGALLV